MNRALGWAFDAILLGGALGAVELFLGAASLQDAAVTAVLFGPPLALLVYVFTGDGWSTPGSRLADRLVTRTEAAHRAEPTPLRDGLQQTWTALTHAFAVTIVLLMVFWGLTGFFSSAREGRWLASGLELAVAIVFSYLLVRVTRELVGRRPKAS
jgi:hypothetical protein